MPSPIEILKQSFKALIPSKVPGHGPWEQANSGWCDAKPYDEVYANGMFWGYDGSVWIYYGFRPDVKVEFTESPMEAMENQHFFVTLMNSLAEKINDQTQKKRGDTRRKFHIQITQDTQEEIRPYDGCTPAHADYLKRMSANYRKPVWSGYIGIQIHEVRNLFSTLSTVDGVEAKWELYKELLENPDSLQIHNIKQDIDEINQLADEVGLVPLDFSENIEDHERLTAWHGVSDEDYGVPRQLSNTRFQEPVHGKSIITPRWGEITFHAVKASKTLFMVDPISDAARWSNPLFYPRNNIVCINIRGEVRSADVAENIMSDKRTINLNKSQRATIDPTSSITDRERVQQNTRYLDKARQSSTAGNGLLDNVEITVATKVIPGKPNKLHMEMSRYQLEVVPLIGRQPMALNNTFPAYPNPIYPVPRGNYNRSVLSNQMFAGVLAYSGLLRKASPCADGGILMGLSEAGHEYNEIYTEVDAANKKNSVPVMLCSGRPGAGKTQQLLQMSAQAVYQGYRVFFLNPKPDATLKPFFDLLGALTINMTRDYLNDNPGLLDPMLFLDNKDEIKSTLFNAITMGMRLNIVSDSTAQDVVRRRTLLETEINDRIHDPRLACSGQIIFGIPEAGIPPISDGGVVEFIENRMRVSPFWKSLISMDPSNNSHLRDQLLDGRPVLIEWDKSLQLPQPSDAVNSYNDDQIESILSITMSFRYATSIVGEGRHGGMVVCDESWVLKMSEDSMKIIVRGSREWRQLNIMLVLGTQRIKDFISDGDDLATYIGRFLFMAISKNDKQELDLYYELTNLERTEQNTRFIQNAGVLSEDRKVRKKIAPRAFYVDQLYGWSGGIICGPFPERELNAGRTDKAGELARQNGSYAGNADSNIGGIGGFLSTILTEDEAIGDNTYPELSKSAQ